MPGKSRLTHPVPGWPEGIDRNRHVLVWCECMAQTRDQLRWAEAGAVGEPPHPRQTRGWDVLGAVETIRPGSPTGKPLQNGMRLSNENAPAEVRAMWDNHVRERKARIRDRQG